LIQTSETKAATKKIDKIGKISPVSSLFEVVANATKTNVATHG
jgi:hypothetical protein